MTVWMASDTDFEILLAIAWPGVADAGLERDEQDADDDHDPDVLDRALAADVCQLPPDAAHGASVSSGERRPCSVGRASS